MAALAFLVLLAANQRGLVVRASEAAAPCVQAAARADSAPAGVVVETGELRSGTADVLVGSSVEITRAVESDRALDEAETDIARIPWVLAVAGGNPLKLGSLDDLAAADADVAVLGGPAAYEARRALALHRKERVHETTDASALSSAAVALVPLSLAGSGERVAVEIPPLVIRAVVAASARRPEEARAFLRFLGSISGQKAFAACAAP
jgi:accessory colonization factor AcfC